MIRFVFFSFSVLLISHLAYASTESVSISDSLSLKEKLTGKIDYNVKSRRASQKQPEKKNTVLAKVQKQSPSSKGLAMARQAKQDGQFILALKRYNFIMKHFSGTPEAKLALLDKAQIYKEMGLDEQAKFNKNKAAEINLNSNLSAKKTRAQALKNNNVRK